MKYFAPLLLVFGLTVLFWPEGQTGPAPVPPGPIEVRKTDDGATTVRKSRAIWRRGVAAAAKAQAAGLRDGSIKTDVSGVEAWANAYDKVDKEAKAASNARAIALYAEANALPEDQRAEFLAKYYESYGEGAAD